MQAGPLKLAFPKLADGSWLRNPSKHTKAPVSQDLLLDWHLFTVPRTATEMCEGFNNRIMWPAHQHTHQINRTRGHITTERLGVLLRSGGIKIGADTVLTGRTSRNNSCTLMLLQARQSSHAWKCDCQTNLNEPWRARMPLTKTWDQLAEKMPEKALFQDSEAARGLINQWIYEHGKGRVRKMSHEDNEWIAHIWRLHSACHMSAAVARRALSAEHGEDIASPAASSRAIARLHD